MFFFILFSTSYKRSAQPLSTVTSVPTLKGKQKLKKVFESI